MVGTRVVDESPKFFDRQMGGDGGHASYGVHLGKLTAAVSDGRELDTPNDEQ